MDQITLRADCGRCAALCCVALAFDKSPLFAIDKPAGEPCPHLKGADGCGIHASRLERGFGGCVGYDCLGAGQRVTQDLFAGRDWRQDPALLGPMVEAFLIVQRVHEMLMLLEQARRLPIAGAQRARAAALASALEAAGGSPERTCAPIADARAFLRGLRDHLSS